MRTAVNLASNRDAHPGQMCVSTHAENTKTTANQTNKAQKRGRSNVTNKTTTTERNDGKPAMHECHAPVSLTLWLFCNLALMTRRTHERTLMSDAGIITHSRIFVDNLISSSSRLCFNSCVGSSPLKCSNFQKLHDLPGSATRTSSLAYTWV